VPGHQAEQGRHQAGEPDRNRLMGCLQAVVMTRYFRAPPVDAVKALSGGANDRQGVAGMKALSLYLRRNKCVLARRNKLQCLPGVRRPLRRAGLGRHGFGDFPAGFVRVSRADLRRRAWRLPRRARASPTGAARWTRTAPPPPAPRGGDRRDAATHPREQDAATAHGTRRPQAKETRPPPDRCPLACSRRSCRAALKKPGSRPRCS
jgi:hypothetical protein